MQDVKHQPRLGAERPACAVLRHVLLAPWHPAAALARGFRLTALEPDGRIVLWVEALLLDYPADHVAQRRQQVAGLNRRPRPQFLAHLAGQRRKWSLAIVFDQRLDQSGARVSRAVGQAILADRGIAKPAVALSVERPVIAFGCWIDVVYGQGL